MASNSPAPEVFPGSPGPSGAPDATPANTQWAEWNPTEDTVRPVRGRHRVAKQRGGLARSSTVLGVGVIAAVGAGGIATAQDKPAVSISLPDLPDIGSLLDDEDEGEGVTGTADNAPLTALSLSGDDRGAGRDDQAGQEAEDAGEALRVRILQQAEQQQASADAEAKAAAEKTAAEQAAAEAKSQQTAAQKKAEEAEKKAAAEAEAKAEAARLAKLASSYSLPTSSYTLTATYGQSGSMWSSGHHTGLDFAARAGTPTKAVHSGTIKSAGYSGSYGYRIVLELEDGTEIWYCHLSSMTVGVGQQVGTGETIGRVGATGNVTGEHLHLEVRTSGGDGIDPAAWLRSKGLTV
ncbi:M23 family metallopeptidase [Streptomyces sp. SP18CS02]|uniref:M23 family metallopeptidase n=1 Tax=Streptomyces sp. SP18CS02 TaxID=3002531 RepID=UPI002E7800AD|nr:M23 family metallopeptidase [Streptomyces sp. SP18CS02]MEE1754140.1 M23 family metallopeptidase [Streptomyces sp. SP18CS02]